MGARHTEGRSLRRFLRFLRFLPFHRERARVGAIAWLLVLMLLLGGCGHLGGASATGRGTATTRLLPQAPQLAWQQANLPPQAATTPYVLGFAPSNGDIVYACSVDPRATQHQLHLWVTRDRGAHWQHLADLSIHTGSNRCSLAVDGLQPARAVVAVNWSPMGAGPELFNSASYVTLDGGASWRQLSGPYPYLVRQLATRHGVTYADLFVELPASESDEIATSSDQLRTWRVLPQTQSFGLSGTTPSFWVDPATGGLLVAGAGLWRSDDGGVRWTALTPPLSPTDPGAEIAVQAPLAGQPWHICIATALLPSTSPRTNRLACSLDGGQTWAERPGLNVAFTNPAKGTFYPTAGVFALDTNGAVLAGLITPSDQETLYRLSSQAPAWQSLGSIPGAAFPVLLVPAPSYSVLWALSDSRGWIVATYP